MKIQAQAIVTYTCELSDEDVEKIKRYIDANSPYWAAYEEYTEEEIINAVRELSSECEIDLYKNSVESDFNTVDIDWSEFEEMEPGEIMGSFSY